MTQTKKPPLIKECFTRAQDYCAVGQFILREYISNKHLVEYDFAHCLVFYGVSNVSTERIIPFSQMDRDVLETMRDILIEKGGNPPALPHQREESNLLNKEKTTTITRHKP